MAVDSPDQETMTWRKAAIIGFVFLTLVVAAGVALIVFGDFFGGLL